MATGTVKIEGLTQAVERLKALPKELRKTPGRAAVGKGAAVIRKAAKANALRVDDSETGRKIADNIGQRFRSKEFKRTGDLMVSVGVLSGKGKIPDGNPDAGPKGDTKHWHLVELGSAKMAARPFLRPALSDNAQAATDAIATELNNQIDKIVKATP